jgi:hypothetical protein
MLLEAARQSQSRANLDRSKVTDDCNPASRIVAAFDDGDDVTGRFIGIEKLVEGTFEQFARLFRAVHAGSESQNPRSF